MAKKREDFIFVNGHSYNHIDKFLNIEVHEPLFSKVKKLYNSALARSDMLNAAILQSGFQKIKNYYKNGQENSLSRMLKGDLAKEFDQNGAVRRLFDYEINHYKSQSSTTHGTDFEKDLEQIIMEFMSNDAISVGEQMKVINVGTKGATTSALFTEEQIIKIWKTIIGKKMSSGEKWTLDKIKSQLLVPAENGLWRLRVKQQKVDLNIPTFEITGELESTWFGKFMTALSGATFSAKNYSISDQGSKSLKVSLGHTSKTRVYSSILSYTNPHLDGEKIGELTTILTKSKQKTGHKAHMTFVYELMGAGLKYNDLKPAKEVRYLIVNARNSNEIFVISTKWLVSQFLQEQHKQSMTGGNNLILNTNGLTISYKNSDS